MNLAERLLAEATAVAESLRSDVAAAGMEQNKITREPVGSTEESRLAFLEKEISFA